MIIREYDVYLNENTKQTEEILLKVIDVYEAVTADETLLESKKLSRLGDKMSNLFGGVLKGLNLGKKVGDILKGWQKEGAFKSADALRKTVCSAGAERDDDEPDVAAASGGIVDVDDFERITSLMGEIFSEMDEDFKSQFRPQLEELFDLLSKYAKANNIKFMSQSVFKRVMRF